MYLCGALLSALLALAAATAPAPILTVDTQAVSRRFDGIGGLSGGGATSRLLVSYSDEVKAQLLDLLFKPNYVASLDILKVEIGGDAQSTDGTESSHMHFRDEVPVYDRGYEWWLMKEAKARNPDITLYGLPWAFPGWLGDGYSDNSPYHDPALTADYVAKWVQGANSTYGLKINYVGIWNERGYTIDYIDTLRSTLDAYGFADTLIVAHDQGWDIATDILNNATLAAAVDVIGCHYPGTTSASTAEATGKQLWASEDMSTYNDLRGSGCWARIVNQNFVNGNMTATISWNLIASYYHGLPWYGTALMTAAEPWSGSFDTENIGMMWATAHTTHFTAPGWHYLAVGSGSGLLPQGGSYVSLVDGSGGLTIVIEKMAWAHSQCIRPSINNYTTVTETVSLNVTGPDAPTSLHMWVTQFGWDGMQQTQSSYFKQGADVKVIGGTVTLTVPVDAIITLTTETTTAGVFPSSAPSAPFPVPYTDNFEGYPINSEANYFADQVGVWEITQSSDASHGLVMRQKVPIRPITWSGDYAPYSVLGDVTWENVDISIDVSVISPGGVVFLGSRTRACCTPPGVFLSVNVTTSTFGLFTNLKDASAFNIQNAITSGPYSVAASSWHTLRLVLSGGTASGWIDDATLFTDAVLPTGTSTSGWVTIGTGVYAGNQFVLADFDNFAIASAKSLSCAVPAPGVNLTTQWCGPALAQNNQWNFDWDTGLISLKAFPNLCMSAPPSNVSNVVTLATCDPSSPTQTFSKLDSSNQPHSTIKTNGQVLNSGAAPGSAFTTSPGSAQVSPCGSSISQKFALSAPTGTGTITALANGLCLDGWCKNVSLGCEPLSFAPCTGSSNEKWTFTAKGQLMNVANGGCADVWNSGAGPSVGIFKCDNLHGQSWTYSPSSQTLTSQAPGNRCLASDGGGNSQFMINEFGNGELTFYGPFVTDFCVTAC